MKCKALLAFQLLDTALYKNISFYFQGGSVIRMFHKELEAYIVAEGLFDDDITEDGKHDVVVLLYYIHKTCPSSLNLNLSQG